MLKPVFCPESRYHYIDLVPESPTKFKYLNSGTIIGYAGFLKEMLEEISIDETTSDQGQLWDYFMKYQTGAKKIFLDHCADLFLTLQSVDLDEVAINADEGCIHYLPTGTTPIVVHGNGDGKPYYQHLYDRLFGTRFYGPHVLRLQQECR